MQASSSRNESDMVALLKFKDGITSDPHGIFNSWNDSLPFCQWFGITCSGRHDGRVTSMVLKGKNLVGTISPFIGNLSFLRDLNLQNNSFRGQIPQEIGYLSRLLQLSVNNNTLDGEIPENLTRCSQLRILDLSWNNLTGKIPADVGSLSMLEIIQISTNNLIGKIPPSIGNLSSLNLFSAIRNHLEGSIPDEIGRLTNLTQFTVGDNRLSGKFPPSLFNISSIKLIATARNQLEGSLLSNIGLTLPNLQRIGLGINRLSGSIPSSFCSASKLEILDLTGNNFVGQVPNCLGNLKNLWWLNVGINNLGTNSTTDLEFLPPLNNCTNLKNLAFNLNNLGGSLPNSVVNLSVQLSQLLIGSNQITGIIPEGLNRFTNLVALDMGHNLFHGTIPFSIGNLQNIRILVLEDNRLSGQIPSSIGNLSNLYQISIAQNKLEGNIPVSITNCQNLQYLDISDNNLNGTIPDDIFRISSLSLLLNLSHNSFTGNLSWDISKLININKLDISGNKLSGEIPETIGACVSLEFLYLQENSFQGIIPASLNSLKGLQELDLSRNHLTGEIPKDLQSLDSLKYLNLSYNNLAGQIPTEGVFSNLSAVFLTGNNNLCGGLTELQQPECRTKRKSNSSAAILAIIIVTSVIISVMLAIAVSLVYLRGRKLKTTSLSAEPEEIRGLMSVSYTDLYNTTNGFSGDNLIGSGSFGSVYKGYLTQMERHVAIKVLKLETNGAAKSLTAECKVLSSVRHRNLVKLLTYCSSIDYKGNEFKALVYELMDNGSLEKWLHHDDLFVKLNFLRRLNIATDVASALHYLHDLCENPIVHCDLKPSNVLLDNDMVAHLGDFGLAKLFLSVDGVSQGQTTSSVGIRGTIGYTPPEYGMSGTASKEGDVYSYGILVLELFTGKRPTDQIFEGHTNLHNYVKNSLPNDAEKVMDPALLLSKEKKGKSVLTVTKKEDENCLMSSQVDDDEAEEETDRLCRLNYDKVKECLVSVFKVGVGCSNESPHERMHMGDVVKELHLIRSHFVGVRIYG